MRAREMDAASGRFLSEDPARDDSNLYRYTGNNPASATDPSGLEPLPEALTLEEYRQLIRSPGYMQEIRDYVDVEARKRWLAETYGPAEYDQERFFSELWLFFNMMELEGDVTLDRSTLTGGDSPFSPLQQIRDLGPEFGKDLTGFRPRDEHLRILDERLHEIAREKWRLERQREREEWIVWKQEMSSIEIRRNLSELPDISEAGHPGTLEGLIPIWGPAKTSAAYYDEGRWVLGTVYAAIAVTDVFLVRSIITGLGRLAFSRAGKEGAETIVREGSEAALRDGGETLSRTIGRETTTETVTRRVTQETGEQLQRVVTHEAGEQLQRVAASEVTEGIARNAIRSLDDVPIMSPAQVKAALGSNYAKSTTWAYSIHEHHFYPKWLGGSATGPTLRVRGFEHIKDLEPALFAHIKRQIPAITQRSPAHVRSLLNSGRVSQQQITEVLFDFYKARYPDLADDVIFDTLTQGL